MRLFHTTLSICWIAAAASLSAQAAEEPFQASVEVLQPIVISIVSANTTLTFGQIVPSNNGSPNTFQTFGDLQPTGAGNGSYISGRQQVQFRIDGTDGEAITYTVVPGACTDAANLSLALNNSGGTFAADIAFTLHGFLTVQSGTPAGTETCNYTVTANYQ